MKDVLPAVLGGAPAFTEEVPFARPTLHIGPKLDADLHDVLESGQLTNGPQVEAFENEAAEFLGVRNVIAVSNCTTGLMLTFRVLGLTGELVLPSFTFMASGHAALWNQLRPRFADVDTETCTARPDRIAEAVGAHTAAILAVHTFGAPCDMNSLTMTAETHRVPLITDAAHAFGGRYEDGSRIGSKGLAEIFSLSPTKPFSAGEGGIIATHDDSLAQDLKVARNYGNPGSYDSVLLGLNARLTEFSAVIGRHGLPRLPEWIERRQHLAKRYRMNLRDVPGLAFQRVAEGASATYKDLCLIIEADRFGLDRDAVAQALTRENIPSRTYFSPPLHRQSVYQQFADSSQAELTGTEWLAARVIALPIYSHMRADTVDAICAALRRIHDHAQAIRSHLNPDAALSSVL